MMKTKDTFVRMKAFPNRTATGRVSSTNARKLAQYCAYGRGSQAEQAERPQRGIWHDHTAKPRSHEDVLAWVKSQGQEHPYTYQFILSVKHLELSALEYGQAMKAGGQEMFPSWMLMAHTDSDHSHAHVLAFGDKDIRIKSEGFQQWRNQVQMALAQFQERRLREELEQENRHQENRHQELHRESRRSLGLGLG